MAQSNIAVGARRSLLRGALPPFVRWLLLVVAALIIGALIAYDPSIAAGLAVVAPLAIVCARWTGRVAASLLLWGCLKYAVFQLVPSVSGMLVQVEIALLIFVVLFTLLRLARRQIPDTALLRPYLIFVAFIVVAVVSWLLNSGPLVTLFAGVRSLATMPLLALAAVTSGTKRDMRYLFLGGVALTVLQVPIAFWQFARGGYGADVDLVNGTLGFGGSNLIGIWMVGAFAACFYLYVRRGRVLWLVGAAAFGSVPVMASSRLSIIVLPAFLVGLGILALVKGREPGVSRRFVGSLVVLGVLGIALVGVIYAGYARSGVRIGTAFQDLDPTSLIQRQTQIGDYSVPRLAYVTYGWDYLKSQSRVWLVGTGPATAGSGAAAAASPDYESTPFAVGLRLQSQGIATYAAIARVVTQTGQFVSTFVEYGPVGLVLMMSFYIVVGWRALKLLFRRAAPSVMDDVLLGSLPVFFLFATVGTVYGVTWEGLNIVGLGLWWSVILSGSLGGAGAHLEEKA